MKTSKEFDSEYRRRKSEDNKYDYLYCLHRKDKDHDAFVLDPTTNIAKCTICGKTIDISNDIMKIYNEYNFNDFIDNFDNVIELYKILLYAGSDDDQEIYELLSSLIDIRLACRKLPDIQDAILTKYHHQLDNMRFEYNPMFGVQQSMNKLYSMKKRYE